MTKIIRKIEIWEKREILYFQTETQWKKKIKEIKGENFGNPNIRIRTIKDKLLETDELLADIEKEVNKYKEEVPKLTRRERLNKFKESKKNGNN